MTLPAPYTPVPVDNVLVAFPAIVSHLMPDQADIPEEFTRHRGTDWNQLVSLWFFTGLPEETEFHWKEGIDGVTAARHIYTILRSFEPKHEHKEAAVAFLMSQWLDKVTTPDRTYSSKEAKA